MNHAERLKALKAASITLAVELPGEGTEIEIARMRVFLARVVFTPLMAIKITGNPETDENTDLLDLYLVEEDEPGHRSVTTGKLCPLKAMEIDNVFERMENAGEASHSLMPQAREVFAEFISTRPVLYP